ncbi:calcium-dependent protein kinase 17-like [Andrographis paniculata]|uniref:calcium-dependent protein kinase 17-like n=1 Tax=Andrographis paniculata TaxID=175694 RepID=UPI0021E8B3AB|nr:calcium-dependent protein kinase 17-like [Andrographis paniculata]XP_051143454.1 calcium-dependent protein kinase 17-like [Andrographis paniculata]XP_051143455.1 calcium-dependent protein kinase 17-like [Andrographis paniculata]
MAVGYGGSSSSSLCYSLCSCYGDPNLSEGILDVNQSGNLSDKYVLGEQLGWGQFGVIRECIDKTGGEILACKSIAKDRLVAQEDVQSIKLEIEIMTRLSGHPNVVDLKAVYEDEGYVHLVMELCAGGELFHKLEKHGRFSELKAREIFRHLMEVVMYCHDKGVVHRDLKPENILLSNKSDSSPIKLADFGLATYIRPGRSLYGKVGSPFYIAPEVLAGGYDQAADVWSAGVILYILLSGIPPFWGKTKSQIFDAVRAADLWFSSNLWDSVSDSAKELIRGMLCKDTSRRLTAQQVLDHPWLRDAQLPNDGCDFEQGCVLPPQVTRSRDISFCVGSPEFSGFESSLSSFLVGSSRLPSENCGFSFRNTVELQTPVPALPSFAFFGSSFAVEVEQRNGALDLPGNSSRIDLLPRGDADGDREDARISGRRNHTIGLGEVEHLVTESVIRWASCNNLLTAASLRPSLVC